MTGRGAAVGVPPRRVAFSIRHFSLDRARVLDVGCGEGSHLAHFGPGSVGLELREQAVGAARARGLDVRQWEVGEGIPPELAGAFDAVWSSNLLEHLVSPHLFLLDTHPALRPGGLLLAVVPIARRLAVGPWRGFLAADHVNFFTPNTLRLTVERGGFDVEYLGSPSLARWPRRAGSLLRAIAPNLLVVGRRIEGFAYPDKAHKRLVEGKVEHET